MAQIWDAWWYLVKIFPWFMNKPLAIFPKRTVVSILIISYLLFRESNTEISYIFFLSRENVYRCANIRTCEMVFGQNLCSIYQQTTCYSSRAGWCLNFNRSAISYFEKVTHQKFPITQNRSFYTARLGFVSLFKRDSKTFLLLFLTIFYVLFFSLIWY